MSKKLLLIIAALALGGCYQAHCEGPGCVGTSGGSGSCPALMCPEQSAGCEPALDANGCPTCGCKAISCSSDGDCPSGQSCEQVECTIGPCPAFCTAERPDAGPSTCVGDSECPSGTHCVQLKCNRFGGCGNQCVRDDPDAGPAGCESDSDCPIGQLCEFDALIGAGECVAAADAGAPGCFQDADCPSGDHCEIPSCCPPGEACMCPEAAGTCEPNIEHDAGAGCITSADCGAGQACDRPQCGNGWLCCDQVPPGVELPCIDDTTPGSCVPGSPCGDSFCTADEVCVEYGGAENTPVCVAQPEECSTVAACDCLSSAICGANDSAAAADCSGQIPTVSCGYP